MVSLRARLANKMILLLGIKTYFANPETVDKKLAKTRAKGPDLPKKSFLKKYNVTVETVDEYEVYAIEPGGASAPAKTVLFFHGGGYVLDMAWAHWNFIGRLIDLTGVRVIAPLYPLAPEHKCAQLLPKMDTLYQRVSAQYGADTLTLMGDSAGGGLALALMHDLRDASIALPAQALLLSPWLDATASDPRQPALEVKDPMISLTALSGFAGLYAGDLDIKDPRISPLFGRHHDLPPIAVFAGTADTIYPDATRFKARADAEGASVTLHSYPDMFHCWMLLGIPEGKQATAEIAGYF